MVSGGGQDGHKSEAGAQQDPAADVQEAVGAAPGPGPAAHHVATIRSSP